MPNSRAPSKAQERARREYGRKFEKKNYTLDAKKRLAVAGDGRRLHLSSQGAVSILQDSSEEEEKDPRPRVAKAAFASILEEAKNSHPTEPHRQGIEAGSYRNPPESHQSVVRNRVPEAQGTEAYKIRERRIQEERRRYLRTTVPYCKKQHIILVCQWAFSDPLNRKGTWSVEVHDYRQKLWMDDVAVEEHKSCETISRRELPGRLARAMVDHWKEELPKQITQEPDHSKRMLLREQLNESLAPSITSIERELRPLVVLREESGPADEPLIERRARTVQEAKLAVLAEKMNAQKKRKANSDNAVSQELARLRTAQRFANSAVAGQDGINGDDVQIPTVRVTKEVRAVSRKIALKKKEAALFSSSQKPKGKPIPESQKASRAIKKPSGDALEASRPKRKIEPDSPSADSGSSDFVRVKPPQSSSALASRPQAKPRVPSVRKPAVPFAKHAEAKKAAPGGLSGTNELLESSAVSKVKQTKAKKATGARKPKNKAHKSDEFLTESDLENDKTEAVELLSDKLHSEDLSVETTTTTATQGDDTTHPAVETTTVTIQVQQQNGAVERIEITSTTTAIHDSSEPGKQTVKHATHTQTATRLDAPGHELPRPWAEQELQGIADTPASAKKRRLAPAPPSQDPGAPNTPDALPAHKTAAPSVASPLPPPSRRKRKAPSPDDDDANDDTTTPHTKRAKRGVSVPSSAGTSEETAIRQAGGDEQEGLGGFEAWMDSIGIGIAVGDGEGVVEDDRASFDSLFDE